jgi:hypothetical protein
MKFSGRALSAGFGANRRVKHAGQTQLFVTAVVDL